MPRFRSASIVARPEMRVSRVVCDGCDPAKPVEERAERAQLWVLTAGAFEVCDRSGRHAVDPTRALVVPAGSPHTIRHPSGPDVCLCVSGSLVDAMAAGGRRVMPINAGQHARLVAEVAASRRGQGDELALAEALAAIGASDARDERDGAAPCRDRDLAAALAHVVRLRFAEPSSLTELAADAGASVFHACRVFRRATGATLHGFRRELRLRHALTMLLDGDAPLADVAAQTGFASQSHLTNLFRARFGVTPGAARRGRVAPARL